MQYLAKESLTILQEEQYKKTMFGTLFGLQHELDLDNYYIFYLARITREGLGCEPTTLGLDS